MIPLAILLCLGSAAAQGQDTTVADRAALAGAGLKMVAGQLVDINTPTQRRARSGRPGIRQGGPACRWLLLDFGDFWPKEEALTPAYDLLSGYRGWGGAGVPFTPWGFGYGDAGLGVFAPGIPGLVGGDVPTDLSPISVVPTEGGSLVSDVPPRPDQPVPVSEPPALALFAGALALLAFFRRHA